MVPIEFWRFENLTFQVGSNRELSHLWNMVGFVNPFVRSYPNRRRLPNQGQFGLRQL
jgi:hypothetical protein